MKSKANPDFWECYRKLPPAQRKQARKAYRLWLENPNHPSLAFKRISHSEPLYSVRINDDYRTVGLFFKEDNQITWFWIGSHADYDQIIKAWR